MTTVDTEALAKKLREGLEGVSLLEWNVECDEIGCGPDAKFHAVLTDELGVIIAEDSAPNMYEDTPSPALEYIARCSPPNILALLDERDELIKKVAEGELEDGT